MHKLQVLITYFLILGLSFMLNFVFLGFDSANGTFQFLWPAGLMLGSTNRRHQGKIRRWEKNKTFLYFQGSVSIPAGIVVSYDQFPVAYPAQHHWAYSKVPRANEPCPIVRYCITHHATPSIYWETNSGPSEAMAGHFPHSSVSPYLGCLSLVWTT